jgi:hypothetical protein
VPSDLAVPSLRLSQEPCQEVGQAPRRTTLVLVLPCLRTAAADGTVAGGGVAGVLAVSAARLRGDPLECRGHRRTASTGRSRRTATTGERESGGAERDAGASAPHAVGRHGCWHAHHPPTPGVLPGTDGAAPQAVRAEVGAVPEARRVQRGKLLLSTVARADAGTHATAFHADGGACPNKLCSARRSKPGRGEAPVPEWGAVSGVSSPFDTHRLSYSPFSRHRLSYSPFSRHTLSYSPFSRHTLSYSPFSRHRQDHPLGRRQYGLDRLQQLLHLDRLV